MTDCPSLTLEAMCFGLDAHDNVWILSDQGILRALDLNSGQVRRRHAAIEDPERVEALVIDPFGGRVVIIDEFSAKLYEDPLSVGAVLDLPFAHVSGAAFSPDGEQLAMLLDEGVLMLVAIDGFRTRWQRPLDHDMPDLKVRFNTDGTSLAVGRGGDAVAIFDASTGDTQQTLAFDGRPVMSWATEPGFKHWALATHGGEDVITAQRQPGTALAPWSFAQAVTRKPVTAIAMRAPQTLWATTCDGELVQLEPQLRDIHAAVAHPDGEPAMCDMLALSTNAKHLISRWDDGRVRLYFVGDVETTS